MKIGYCLTGSFCTFDKSIDAMKKLVQSGHDITPIMSYNAYSIDTRFGKAEDINKRIVQICQNDIIHSIEKSEPIGPNKMFDILIVAPCTSNTLAKLANGVNDTPVTMAVKSHLRNDMPVIIGVSTNDALSSSAKNIGLLLNMKNYYFVPMKMDSPSKKPKSIVCDFELIEETLNSVSNGIQPKLIL